MAEPIYKFWITKTTEAWYQLSEKEQQSHTAKVEEARQKVGGKSVLVCSPAWSAQQWLLCGVEEFPDTEAVQKHTQMLYEMGHFRYFASQSVLGIKWPPE